MTHPFEQLLRHVFKHAANSEGSSEALPYLTSTVIADVAPPDAPESPSVCLVPPHSPYHPTRTYTSFSFCGSVSSSTRLASPQMLHSTRIVHRLVPGPHFLL